MVFAKQWTRGDVFWVNQYYFNGKVLKGFSSHGAVSPSLVQYEQGLKYFPNIRHVSSFKLAGLFYNIEWTEWENMETHFEIKEKGLMLCFYSIRIFTSTTE